MEAKMETTLDYDLVPVYFYGKRYDIPRDLTVLQALEFAGHQFTRGCGCRGGVCGACAAVFMHPDSNHLEVGLACQIQVIPEMRIIQLPYFPVDNPGYNLDQLTPSIEEIGQIYPNIYRCVACNTCTKMCPQEIKVMDCISRLLRGEIESVAWASRDCVMCGLCTSRCPAEIPQFLIMLLVRRLYGRFIQKPYRYLPIRLKQIEAGEFKSELDEMMHKDLTELKTEYHQLQKNKQII